MASAESTIVTFLPSTRKVFFCKFGLKARLVLCIELGTLLCPDILPLPVSSHLLAIINVF